jgi:hypothetical protein
MSDSSKSATQSRNHSTDGVGEVLGQIARNAAGELVKGSSSLADTTKRVVADAIDTLDEKGPELAKNAGFFTWRYALLGWATWNVGKVVVKRRTKKKLRRATAPVRRKAAALRNG